MTSSRGNRPGTGSSSLSPDTQLRLAEYERSFRKPGLPLFSEEFSAGKDIFNRALPLLGIVFIGELLGAGQLDWSWWQNLLAIVGALALVLVAVGLMNRARGRPFSTIPSSIDAPELTGFVVIPALLPLIFGGQIGSAVVTALANLALLAVILGIGAYGLPSILRWIPGRIASQLRASLGLIAKALPLLAIFILLAFPTQELWAIFSHPTRGVYVLIVGLFAFLAVRLSREAQRLEAEVAEGPPLSRSQRINVGLVMFVSQALQVLIVSLTVFIFLAAFGVLAVDDSLRIQWLDSPGHELFYFTLFDERLELTSELLRVAAGLAAFSGFYFAIAMLTDDTYRSEFLEELTSEMKSSFTARAEYLKLRKQAGVT